MKKIGISIMLIAIIALSAWYGGHTTSVRMTKTVKGLQAKLAFSHWKMYQDLHSDLVSGCDKQAFGRLSYAIDGQMMLMAEYLQNTKRTKFEEYLKQRNPELMNVLRTYEVNWKKVWKSPGCGKKEGVDL